MNNIVLREFKLFFRNEDEARSRASEYMKSDFRKSADRRNLLVGGAIGGVAAATGYVLEYLLGLASESYVSQAVTVGGLMAAVLLLPQWWVDAARKYLRENFEPQPTEGSLNDLLHATREDARA